MKKVSMRKALQILGATEIELKCGYHYQYGFFNLKDQLYYINSGDDRMRKPDGQLNIMYRTAEHRKDWHGGANQWDFLKQLNNKGYAVTTCRVKQ